VKYIFDSSALIEPWNRHYPIDVFPQLWDSLGDLVDTGIIRAPFEVRRELERKSDPLLEWALARADFFVDADAAQLVIVRQIVNTYPDLVGPNSQRSQADPFVIAMGEQARLPVVTYENRAKNGATPKIPNVCEARGVRMASFVDVLRAEGAKF
jgi:hypothetical protein